MRSTRSGAVRRFRDSAVFLSIAAAYIALELALGGDVPCYFKATLGVPCPGCGLTRAYLALLEGDLSSAFFYHPLFFVPPVIAAVVILKDVAGLNRLYRSGWFWWGAVALFLAQWAVRMALFFPYRPPMDFNDGSFLWKLVSLIVK
jgi:hypothetical protein